jgi:hypothetical protein
MTAMLSTTLLLAGAAGAAAAPPDTEPIFMHCSDGGHYEIWVNGSGMFTPGNIVGSTSMIVPVWFGDNMLTVTPPGEAPIEMPLEDDAAKGNGHPMHRVNREMVTCTYSETFTLTESEEGFPAGSVVTFSGAVMGFLTGR